MDIKSKDVFYHTSWDLANFFKRNKTPINVLSHYRLEFGKLWTMSQIQLADYFGKSRFIGTQSHSLNYTLSVAAFALQQQSGVTVT